MLANHIRADFDQRVVAPPPNHDDWLQSPAPGVWRYPLDRLGGEIARATSLVRYGAGCKFAHHSHGGGEEILVLEGIFSDGAGDYPAGTYLRNPPGTSHQPFSREGCLLLVKLWQFAQDDLQSVQVNTHAASWYPGMVSGLSVMPLHNFNGVNTALVRWAPRTQFNLHSHPGGEEIYVLSGVFHDEYGAYPAGSWIRSPRWSKHTPFTGEEGATIYVKTGHIGAQFLTPTL